MKSLKETKPKNAAPKNHFNQPLLLSLSNTSQQLWKETAITLFFLQLKWIENLTINIS